MWEWVGRLKADTKRANGSKKELAESELFLLR
jgi:hypothetical protein